MKKRLTAFILTLAIVLTSAAGITAFAETGSTQKQVRITEQIPVLDENGYLTQSGYCFTPLYTYDRNAIQTAGWRTKEWDFYQISNDRYCMQITIADISLGGACTIGFFDMQTGKAYSTMILDLFTFGKFTEFTDSCMDNHLYSFHRNNFTFDLEIKDNVRTIKFDGKANGKKLNVDVTLDMLPEHESHVIAVPFDTKDGKHFYLNEKTNCMAANGTISLDGETVVNFKGVEDNSFGVLDWGRGVWPFHETWWWGNGSTVLENGKIFGMELGWGFGNTSEVTENTLFYDGKAYKIGNVIFENQEEIVKPLSSDWVKSGKGTVWKFTSDDGSFEMEMTPVYDNYTMMRFVCVGNLCHQVFGKWNGTVKCGDETIEIKDMYAFLERSDNMW